MKHEVEGPIPNEQTELTRDYRRIEGNATIISDHHNAHQPVNYSAIKRANLHTYIHTHILPSHFVVIWTPCQKEITTKQNANKLQSSTRLASITKSNGAAFPGTEKPEETNTRNERTKNVEKTDDNKA